MSSSAIKTSFVPLLFAQPLPEMHHSQRGDPNNMKNFAASVLLSLVCVPFAFADITATSPSNGATVASPVHYAATATAPTCAKGVASIGVYVNNQLAFVQNGSTLSTDLQLSAGTYQTTVHSWDNCGGASATPISITVSGGTTPPPASKSAVTVSSPANNSNVTSPVTYTATATTSCAQGISSMGVYVNNKLAYQANGASLSTKLTLSGGAQQTVVQEWDNCGGAASTAVNVTVQVPTAAAVTLTANPLTIAVGSSSTLTATATNATQVVITGSDGSTYVLQPTGGTQTVTPATTVTYTASATGNAGNGTASATVTSVPANSTSAVNHVVLMLQENHSFDNYFGMLNPYRKANGFNIGDDGKDYEVDGIDDKLATTKVSDDEGAAFSLFKLKSTCIDDATSSWLESYGDVYRWDFTPSRPITMDGFVHTAENYSKLCVANNGTGCSGAMTDLVGQRVMGYYDQSFLNYYYYMASQYTISDRWFSPISSKSIPNRVATFTGGTLQGLVFDPGADDHLPQLQVNSIFQELDGAKVPWKIYYSVTQGACLSADDCSPLASAQYPATDYGYVSYSYRYLYENPTGAACIAPTQASSVVGDKGNTFCIDPSHIAPLSTYFTDLTNGTLPAFAFIEAGYGHNDEHPGSGQSILAGQQQVAKVINAFVASPAWKDSIFFMTYDEGGGPYDHVPPVPKHSNDFTAASLGTIPDIASIAVNPDSYNPCLPSGSTPTLHCDLHSTNPGAHPGDATTLQGVSAQLGFRVPNLVISSFSRKHYVSHVPMDHTAILKFVENRFIGPSAHLTARDAAQPNLLDMFDFTGRPWAVPPTPPVPVTPTSLGYDPCTPTTMGP